MAVSTEVIAGENIMASQYNDLRGDVVLSRGVMGTESDVATVTLDASDKTKGRIRTVTITANRAIQISNATAGQTLVLRIIQGGSGGYTISSWLSGKTLTWNGDVAPVLGTAVGDIDTIGFICVATDTFEGYYLGRF